MKTGRQSSEFLLVLALGGIMLANGTEFIDVPWDQFKWYAGTVVAYVGARSYVKKGNGNGT